MLALISDGHIGGGDPALTKCRSGPRVSHIDAPGLCRPYGEPHEHDGSKSKKKSDANLEDTELSEPEHFASPAGRRFAAPSPGHSRLPFTSLCPVRGGVLRPGVACGAPSLCRFLRAETRE